MAKNNATSPKPSGSVSFTPDNTPQHKLMAMGKEVNGSKADGKKTPA